MLCSMATAYAQDPNIQVSSDGYYLVGTLQKFQDAVKNNLSSDGSKSYSKIRLTKDLYLSDLSERTFNNTFCGTLDGDGHTIYGGKDSQLDGVGHYKRTYLFTYSENATYKNLTFKNIRVESSDNNNQCIITSQAKNNCVFENITFDNVSTWTKKCRTGAAAGYAYNSTFTDIRILNSDFTVDDDYSGTLLGDADGCTFTNIEVNHCESTTHDDYTGGVVGFSANSTFTDVTVKKSIIRNYEEACGGVSGGSRYSTYTRCKTDDETNVRSDGDSMFAYAGGITGVANNDNFIDCINYALISVDMPYGGGIVGKADNNTLIQGCVNVGMIISATFDNITTLFDEYKTGMLDLPKTYGGTTYMVRVFPAIRLRDKIGYNSGIGGIVGLIVNSTVSQCINYGQECSKDNESSPKHLTGGIVGTSMGTSEVRDCLVDFVPFCSSSYAIVGDINVSGMSSNLKIINCLSLVDTKDTSNGEHINYHTVRNLSWATVVNADDLLSGKYVASLGDNWQQHIGVDNHPFPGNNGLSYSRNLVGKDYGTVCLPFTVKSLNGNGRNEREYYTFKEVKNETDGSISLCFKYVDELPAGTPAIFHAVVNGTYDFECIDFNYQFEPQPVVGTEWTFDGTYEQKVFDGDDAKSIYYLDGSMNNTAIKNARKTTVAPYRAFFRGPSIDSFSSAGAKAIRFVIENEDGTTTALKCVGDDLVPVQNGKAYTLMGTEAPKGYKGIVIRNGKKVVR